MCRVACHSSSLKCYWQALRQQLVCCPAAFGARWVSVRRVWNLVTEVPKYCTALLHCILVIPHIVCMSCRRSCVLSIASQTQKRRHACGMLASLACRLRSADLQSLCLPPFAGQAPQQHLPGSLPGVAPAPTAHRAVQPPSARSGADAAARPALAQPGVG